MTHNDLLLLASAGPFWCTFDDARSLVSAFDRLLEERDALSAQAKEAERKLGTAMRAGVAMSEAHEAAVDRASSAESEMVRMRETLRRQVHRHGCEGCEACDGSRAALRSLVSDETNDKEKTR